MTNSFISLLKSGVYGDFIGAKFVFSLTQLTLSFAGGTIVAALNLLKERGVNSKQIKVVSICSPHSWVRFSVPLVIFASCAFMDWS